ncbi:MAG TPA: hypothetical protein VFS35_11040 [Terrimicrobiaceae bacterium]|nr:hypothetical protein [Terrimicrobiaceae bacterium]
MSVRPDSIWGKKPPIVTRDDIERLVGYIADYTNEQRRIMARCIRKRSCLPSPTPCLYICHGVRKSSPWRASSGSSYAAGRSVLYRLREKEVLEIEPARYFVRVIERGEPGCQETA